VESRNPVQITNLNVFEVINWGWWSSENLCDCLTVVKLRKLIEPSGVHKTYLTVVELRKLIEPGVVQLTYLTVVELRKLIEPGGVQKTYLTVVESSFLEQVEHLKHRLWNRLPPAKHKKSFASLLSKKIWELLLISKENYEEWGRK